MQINRKELKIIISRFNSKANRLMQAPYADYIDVLKKFISYIDTTEIIKDYIESCGGYNSEIKFLLDQAKNNEIEEFPVETDEDEVRFIYSMLKHIASTYTEFPMVYICMFGEVDSLHVNLEQFNHRMTSVLIMHISDYLKEIGIEMGLDDNTTFVVSGGQFNYARDNSKIYAVQNNGIATNAEEFAKLFEALRNEINTLGNSEDRTDASESVETIEKELKSEQPNESVLKTCFKFLKRLDPEGKITSICKKIAFAAAVANPVFEGIKSLFT